MKQLHVATIAVVCLFCFAQTVTGQDSSRAETSAHKHSYFEASLSYQSDNVYLGRKDSASLPYYTPMLTYYHKSGLYFSAAASYLHNSTDQRVDVVTLEGGYDYTVGKYGGEISFSKYFYNSQSTSVTSGITGSLSYRSEYDLGFVEPSITLGLDLGPKTDFQGAFELEHTFAAFDDKLEITPSMTANGSTLNFYDNYYKTRRFKRRKGQKTVSGTVDITGTVPDAGSFRILDYEPGLSLKYIAGRFSCSFTPVYAIPVHPAVLDIHAVYSTGSTVNKTVTEKLENSFFCTIGMTYKF
ncbi:MAG: hypothetical protein J0H74_17535 [Chitinophagaceae bacterium]|nr:hypothetical protein [Chitinophagaceae bacterium]